MYTFREASHSSRLLVVEDDGVIIATGYIQIRSSKPSLEHNQHGYLGFMYVAPEYRGQGLNKQVLDALIQWGHQQGVTHFYLDVYTTNKSALNAYEKAGFTSSLLEMKLTIKSNE